MKHFTALFFQLATLVTLAVLIWVFWPVLVWLAITFLVLLVMLVIGIPLWLRYQVKRNFRDAFYRSGPAPEETEGRVPPPASEEIIDTTAVELDDPSAGENPAR